MFQDRGVPPKSSNTTIRIIIQDNDDLPPKFTKGVYRTKISEFYPLSVSITKNISLRFSPINSYDSITAHNYLIP